MRWRGRGFVWVVGVATVVCGIVPRAEGARPLQEMDSVETRNKVLEEVTEMTSGYSGATCMEKRYHRFVRAPLRVSRFDSARQKVDLMARVLRELNQPGDTKLLELMVRNILVSEPQVDSARVLVRDSSSGRLMSLTSSHRENPHYPPTEDPPKVNTTTKVTGVENMPWYEDVYNQTWNSTKFQKNLSSPMFIGWWTYPYFHCDSKRWLLSYTVPLATDLTPEEGPAATAITKRSDFGMLSMDVDVTSLDINQCDPTFDSQGHQNDTPEHQLSYFLGTHKCDNTSSRCVFTGGHGWVRGGYKCECRKGYFARNKTFNGTLVEVAWASQNLSRDPTYKVLYVCQKCPPDCENCTSDEPCMAYYNWPFRITLLTISVLCILLTLVLMGMVYHYRSVKVFRLASPTFLCICLIGCIIMYLEMAAIFPVLDKYSCVATKWTRHLGFCITFSSLLLKTWRVSLTYRVKSAHKIKLTDKQLLQWLTPMLLIMIIYLSAWTVSDPPQTDDILDSNGLKFLQCEYNWWDHSLAMGEVLFLIWGVKVCFSVRKAESFFDEATYISWAVYNIAVVNIVMVTFHLLIFPNAGPDIKYLFGFLRTQCSVTATILFIFGPKFYRIAKGTGDQYDNRARAKGVTASFSLNGLGVMNEEPADLYQENEELKEEIQKLAAQMEFMKIVHMEMNNRHLKPKPGGYFSEKNSVMNTAQSPGAKNSVTSKIESGNENSSARLSPAAELVSERV